VQRLALDLDLESAHAESNLKLGQAPLHRGKAERALRVNRVRGEKKTGKWAMLKNSLAIGMAARLAADATSSCLRTAGSAEGETRSGRVS
jgi:hypothetical protein